MPHPSSPFRPLRAVLAVPFVLLLAAALPAAPASAARPIDHRPFTLVLQGNVRGGRVDYLAIRDTRWKLLNAYLDSMAVVDPLAERGNNRLAYYINLYNATVIHAVIERLHAGYTVSEDKHALFDEPLVRTAGGRISLNELEHQRLRVEFPDPRVHAVLVCASVSCPPLPARAYERNNLGATLDAAMQAFVTDTTRNRVDRAAKKLWLSQIFNWYSQDFLSHGGVVAYVDSILPEDVSGYSVGFLDYDWSLNIAQPDGIWVQARADGVKLLSGAGGSALATLKQGELLRVIGRDGGGWKVERPYGAGQGWLAKGDAAPWRAP